MTDYTSISKTLILGICWTSTRLCHRDVDAKMDVRSYKDRQEKS